MIYNYFNIKNKVYYIKYQNYINLLLLDKIKNNNYLNYYLNKF